MNGLTIEFANCLTHRVGRHGIDLALQGKDAPRYTELIAGLNDSRQRDGYRWRLLPFDPIRSEHVKAIRRLVDEHRARTRNLIVLGIGGSALGNIALQSSLNPPTWNLLPQELRDGPRLFVLDNVDPAHVGAVLGFVQRDDPSLEHTLVNVISKSGETAETAAQFLIVRDRLRRSLGNGASGRIVAITDPKSGTMRAICDAEGYATLPVPEGVGGRFSVLSPVGLFSAAMCGIDIDALLDGAAAMDGRCAEPDFARNPAAVLAWLLMTFTRMGKPIHVQMPYSNALLGLADWYRQLWAESLGKQFDIDGREVFAGATPVQALGATDQHSQIQLYREGPNDKVIGFIEVGSFADDPTIPADAPAESLRYLEHQSIGALLRAEKRATEYALVESERPNFTIRFPRINAHHVGEFIQLWQMTTALAGLWLKINPFDQPAVETGKRATFGLMGRRGFEEWRQRVDQALPPTNFVV